MTIDKTVVVKRETRLEELLKKYVTTSQIKFYLESKGESFVFYQDEHDAYKKSLERVIELASKTTRVQIVDKSDLPTYQFGENDLVVVVGDDGLLVNSSKYLGHQPVISVNADERRYDGVLASCNSSDFPQLYRNVLDGKSRVEEITMAHAKLDDGQSMYALNDLFIGKSTHASARYEIIFDGLKERQSSSGIVVSTGTGSTGWLTSILRGAEKLTGSRSLIEFPYPREEDYLIFAVREAFPSKFTGADLTYGIITKNNPLTIVSNIPENGVIFGDGVEQDYVEFNVGRTAVITPADKKVLLVKKF